MTTTKTAAKVTRVPTPSATKAQMTTYQELHKDLGQGHVSYAAIFIELANRFMPVLIEEAQAEISRQQAAAEEE